VNTAFEAARFTHAVEVQVQPDTPHGRGISLQRLRWSPRPIRVRGTVRLRDPRTGEILATSCSNSLHDEPSRSGENSSTRPIDIPDAPASKDDGRMHVGPFLHDRTLFGLTASRRKISAKWSSTILKDRSTISCCTRWAHRWA